MSKQNIQPNHEHDNAANSDNCIPTTKHEENQATKHIKSSCYLKDSSPTICCLQDVTRQVNTHETWN